MCRLLMLQIYASLLYQLYTSQEYLQYSYVIDTCKVWQFDRNRNSDNRCQK